MKITLSKTTQWILTIGILVALLVSVGVVYARQHARHNELSQQLTQAEEDLETFTWQKEDLESRLDQAESALSHLKDQFPAPAESMEIEQDLLAAADVVKVTITSLSLSAPTTQENYQVFSVNLTALGEAEALLNFNYILGYWFSSATIESVNLTTADGGGKASLNLLLKIYTLEAS